MWNSPSGVQLRDKQLFAYDPVQTAPIEIELRAKCLGDTRLSKRIVSFLKGCISVSMSFKTHQKSPVGKKRRLAAKKRRLAGKKRRRFFCVFW